MFVFTQITPRVEVFLKSKLTQLTHSEAFSDRSYGIFESSRSESIDATYAFLDATNAILMSKQVRLDLSNSLSQNALGTKPIMIKAASFTGLKVISARSLLLA